MKQILFNTDMVCAILDGCKTVTRRVGTVSQRRGRVLTRSVPAGGWYRQLRMTDKQKHKDPPPRLGRR